MGAAFIKGRDPVVERTAAAQPAIRPQSFGEFAETLIDDIESGFRNDKHRKQWRSTLAMHAAALGPKALTAINTEDIVEVLKPIWAKILETASRVNDGRDVYWQSEQRRLSADRN